MRVAARMERHSNLFPPRSRQMRAVDDLALDVFDALIGIDAELGRHLRGCGLSAAGSVGPGHEVIAAETSLAHDILEGDIGGAGHGAYERTSPWALPVARRLEQDGQIGALHHLVLVPVLWHRKTRRH